MANGEDVWIIEPKVFSFSPRIKKLITRILNGKITPAQIATVLVGGKKVYDVTQMTKDEYGDDAGSRVFRLVPKDLKQMKINLQKEWDAAQVEYADNIAKLTSIIALLKEN